MQDLFVHIFVEQGTVLINDCEHLFISCLYLNCLDLLVFYPLSRCVVLKGMLHKSRKYLCQLGLGALETLIANQFLHDELFVYGDVEEPNG